MLDWIDSHPEITTTVAIASAVMFVGTLIAVPWLVARIPTDYFAGATRKPSRLISAHPALRFAVLVARLLLGVVFVLMGIVMLVLPGQGLLTILVGVLLLEFPGKYKVERWLITRRPIARAVAWLRRRAGRPSLVFDAALPDARDTPPSDAASTQRDAT